MLIPLASLDKNDAEYSGASPSSEHQIYLNPDKFESRALCPRCPLYLQKHAANEIVLGEFSVLGPIDPLRARSDIEQFLPVRRGISRRISFTDY